MAQTSIEEQALRQTPFFANLDPDDLEAILRVGEPVSFDAGQPIVDKGAPGDAMYIVTSGTAEVDVGGRFHKLGRGDFFGEMALISETKRLATVTATEPVEALRIPAEAFRAFLMEHPGVALSMMEALVARLREVQQRLDAWMST